MTIVRSVLARADRRTPVLQGILFSRGQRILFADADGASAFDDLTLLQREMDRLLHSTPKAADAPVGHAVVVGSRAHMVNSDAVVKVRPAAPRHLIRSADRNARSGVSSVTS